MRDSRAIAARFIFSTALVFGAASCGDSSEDADAGSADGGDVADDGAAPNACPADGCSIEFVDIVASGDELAIEWSANFTPDFSRNHIHVYWDTYEAGEVSGDAVENGFEQGEWVPTDAYPSFVTEGAVSTGVRGDSTTLCVTAADRDHAVLDTSAVDCRDVSDLL